MNLNEIQDLIKFVAKQKVTEVEIEKKDFKITIKSQKEEIHVAHVAPAPVAAPAAIQAPAAAPAPAPAALVATWRSVRGRRARACGRRGRL